LYTETTIGSVMQSLAEMLWQPFRLRQMLPEQRLRYAVHVKTRMTADVQLTASQVAQSLAFQEFNSKSISILILILILIHFNH
jgi:hypothetical protein